jgi:hypothetical protein
VESTTIQQSIIDEINNRQGVCQRSGRRKRIRSKSCDEVEQMSSQPPRGWNGPGAVGRRQVGHRWPRSNLGERRHFPMRSDHAAVRRIVLEDEPARAQVEGDDVVDRFRIGRRRICRGSLNAGDEFPLEIIDHGFGDRFLASGPFSTGLVCPPVDRARRSDFGVDVIDPVLVFFAHGGGSRDASRFYALHRENFGR